MNFKKGYLAIDMGAESGRVMLGILDAQNNLLRLEQAHRFSHEICDLPAGLYWNITGIWQQILMGIKKGAQLAEQNNVSIAGIGADTWGVDFALLGESDEFLTWPRAYRDPRCHEAHQKLLDQLGAQQIYEKTGIALMPINTLYQLKSLQLQNPAILGQTKSLLFMPDLFHYFLSGKKRVEATIASTSQLTDARTGNWASELLDEAGIGQNIFPKIVESGTAQANLGPLRPEVASLDQGLKDTKVIVPASHDTACAVAAVPAEKNSSWCYLSSGTWSLIGALLDKPVINEQARRAGFTNERGAGGTIRFLKNIAGLWLVQESRRDLAKEGQEYDYAQLTSAAGEQKPFATLIDVTHVPFLEPGNMLQKISAYASATDQLAPQCAGAFVRCCLESLALAYRQALEAMEQVLGRQFDCIHIVGGGAKNQLLNQMTADATGRKVVAGPFEATATGNVLTQALGDRTIGNLEKVSQIVRHSFDVVTIEPDSAQRGSWENAYHRYLELAKKEI